MTHQILIGNEVLSTPATFEIAVSQADELLTTMGEAKTSITIRDETGKLVAVVSNHTEIPAEFIKQKWGGRKGDDAIFHDREPFDGLSAVLALPLNELRELQDGTEEADELGLDSIDWDGPCEVHIEDSVREFFGIDDLKDLTAEALAFVQNRYPQQAPTFEVIEVRVALTIRKRADVTIESVIENMDYTFKANTHGARIVDTEIR